MVYNPQEFEKKILEFWEKNRIFYKLVERNKGKKKWFFLDGPITANNPMGVHHAWGRTYKDIYQRFKAMQGFDQRFQNGFDCQGLWVEVEVEKDLGFGSKKDILNFGLDNFSKACRERVDKFSKVQTNQSIRLGQWMDWENSYYTFSDTNIKYIWHFLKKCHENGWLYKGTKVMPWCIRCGTSLSNHEQSDEGWKELVHPGVFVKFPVKRQENEFILVWTTTAWTLSSNVAAAVHPKLDYVKVKQGEEIYYLSKGSVKVLKDSYAILEEMPGKTLIGLEYTGPYDHVPAQKDIAHRVIGWDSVGDAEGTGIVHIAPGCGEEDNVLGKKERLAEVAPLDESGNYIEGFGWLTGQNVSGITQKIIDDLNQRGILYKTEPYKHRYPVCWRCKQELVFRLVSEWFISADEIRPKMKKAAKKVNWYPEHVGKMMQDWLDNMADWCISRKRFWGLPLMFFECKCGQLEVIGSIEELKQKTKTPGDVDKLPELHRPWIDKIKIACKKCHEEVSRIPDVGDCWLDAGIVPFSTLKYLGEKNYWEKWYPADFICEMRAQVRLWFYSMLFMSVTLENRSPYKSVLAYEEVRDEKGKPMHKSAGNAIWFDDAVEKMGADVMRWVYASQNPQYNLRFGFSIADEARKKIDIFQNLANYVKTYLEANNFRKKKIENKGILTKWFLSDIETAKKSVAESMDSLQPNKASEVLENFFLNDFSRFYVHLIRDKMKLGYSNGDKNEVLQSLYSGMLETLKMLAPFMPFITEQIYQDFFRKFEKKESIHLLKWPKPDSTKIDAKLEESVEFARKIVEGINSCRQDMKIPTRWPLADVSIFLKEPRDMNNVAEIIATLSNARQVNFAAELKDGKEFEWGKIKLGGVLKDEALVRELIRKTQELRKQEKLQVSDTIEAHFNSDKTTLDILEKFEKELLSGVGAKKIGFSEPKEKKGELEFEGKKVEIGFIKA